MAPRRRKSTDDDIFPDDGGECNTGCYERCRTFYIRWCRESERLKGPAYTRCVNEWSEKHWQSRHRPQTTQAARPRARTKARVSSSGFSGSGLPGSEFAESGISEPGVTGALNRGLSRSAALGLGIGATLLVLLTLGMLFFLGRGKSGKEGGKDLKNLGGAKKRSLTSNSSTNDGVSMRSEFNQTKGKNQNLPKKKKKTGFGKKTKSALSSTATNPNTDVSMRSTFKAHKAHKAKK